MLTQQDLYPCFSNSNKIKGDFVKVTKKFGWKNLRQPGISFRVAVNICHLDVKVQLKNLFKVNIKKLDQHHVIRVFIVDF